jgi:hypothetical protein
MGRQNLLLVSLNWSLVLITAILTLRLAATVAVTPSDQWLYEFVPMASGETAAVGEGLPIFLSRLVSDPSVAKALIGDCVRQSASPLSTTREACSTAIDYGLGVFPASSELWLSRARLLANEGILDARFLDSIRNSFATGRREGWIASQRLPFTLRVIEFLPFAMYAEIGGDIALVIQNRTLSTPLAQAYAANPFLQESSWELIKEYSTLEQQERLSRWIRQASRN